MRSVRCVPCTLWTPQAPTKEGRAENQSWFPLLLFFTRQRSSARDTAEIEQHLVSSFIVGLEEELIWGSPRLWHARIDTSKLIYSLRIGYAPSPWWRDYGGGQEVINVLHLPTMCTMQSWVGWLSRVWLFLGGGKNKLGSLVYASRKSSTHWLPRRKERYVVEEVLSLRGNHSFASITLAVGDYEDELQPENLSNKEQQLNEDESEINAECMFHWNGPQTPQMTISPAENCVFERTAIKSFIWILQFYSKSKLLCRAIVYFRNI